jgi:transcriptional regulator with XRE-family HTH domain
MLRSARRRSGLTQRQLATASGIPQPSIARIENGATIPRLDTLQRLLHAAGQDLELEARLGEGVDRTTIRPLLALTPDERGRAAAQAGRNLIHLLRSAHRLDRSPAG